MVLLKSWHNKWLKIITLKNNIILLLIISLVVLTFDIVLYIRSNVKKVSVRHGSDIILHNEPPEENPIDLVSITAFSQITPTLILTPSPVSKPAVRKSGYGIAMGGLLTGLKQQELDKYFAKLKELGITWVRWDIDWYFIQEKDSKSFDWSGVDMVVATAKKYGLTSLGTITGAPRWASSGNCSYPSCPPNDPQVFGQFAGMVAGRYKDSIRYFEIWNEPNYPLFWKKPDYNSYFQLLKSAYINIKNANPSAQVITGGLAASENTNGGSISPLTFLEGLYSLGANKYIDSVGLHPYTYPASADYKANWNHWQEMTNIRTLMQKNGDGSKQIWVTEYGAPTGGPGSVHELNQLSFSYGNDFMSEIAQKDMLTGALTLYRGNSNLGPFFWYTLKDSSDSRNTPENFFGIIRFDGSQKPAYDAYKNAIVPR